LPHQLGGFRLAIFAYKSGDSLGFFWHFFVRLCDNLGLWQQILGLLACAHSSMDKNLSYTPYEEPVGCEPPLIEDSPGSVTHITDFIVVKQIAEYE
jgi:hypothetical protein